MICPRCKSVITSIPRPKHYTIVGDCRDSVIWTRLLAAAGVDKVNIVFTSPPYASQRKYDESSGFKPIAPDEYGDWWEAVQVNVRANLADDGSFFVNIKEHCDQGERHIYVKELLVRHIREWGWRWIEEYAWTHGGTPRAVVNRFKNGWEPIWHLVLDAGFVFRPDQVRHAYVPDQTGSRVESYGGGHPCGADGVEGQQRTRARQAAKAAGEGRSESFKFRPDAVRHETAIEDLPETHLWHGVHPGQEDGKSAQPGGKVYAQEMAAKGRRKKQSGSNASVQGQGGVDDRIISENAKGKAAETGLAYPCNVLSVGRNREALGHGAAFPVALPTFFVRAYSDRGDVVGDPFLGSASTMVAAAQEGRSCVGIEISPKYVDVCRRRMTRWLLAHGLAAGPGMLADAEKKQEEAGAHAHQEQP